MNIHDILSLMVKQGSSDLHIMVGVPPTIRTHGELTPLPDLPGLSPQQVETLLFPIMTQEQKDYVKVNKELDFGYQFQDSARFRVNVYHSKGDLAGALRLIPAQIKSIDELKLLPFYHEFTKYNQGLVLITGPTGEGKSTSLAALIDEINTLQAKHIITIEDPIEFVHQPKKSIISQREINHDTHSWDVALRSALREDPNVVLVGEMRDFETIAAAITIAETGHLVFATLHTATAAETIDRIIDVFPAVQQQQIRQQLASTIKAVASQRLVPAVNGGRVAVSEIMIANHAVQNLIREGKTFQIDTIMQTGSAQGMILFEAHLLQLVQQGVITKEVARSSAFRLEAIDRLLGNSE
ncbi:MAG: type IV pilus twitching motility protein PilT [Patescibacteria group bacterium]|nr:type IV pilus twitching motility protein PilT [Patescibacteria group bacterium]